MSDRRMPELGANPLEVAFQDYQRMEHELELATQEHAAKTDMVNDLLRENEFLRRNYDKAVAERDRYQALAVNLATRAVGVKEAVERLLVEAVSARAVPVADVAVDRAAISEPAGDLTAQMDRLLRGERICADEIEATTGIATIAAREAGREPGLVKRDITQRITAIAPVNWQN